MEFEESGLFELVREICTPGNMLETSHPDIEYSFRWHDWKISYAEMICRWVAPSVSENEYL
ncbi:hypothetical protein B0H13DRAFT_2395203 [Mycena leptocephala]|nr:hypothetical protein B0H13DRAFT_2395203 [Mycena leptocephala]